MKQRKKIVSALLFGALISLNSHNFVSAKVQDKITPKHSPAAWLYTADRPYLETHNPSKDKNETIFFAKDGSFTVDRYMWWNYGINQKADNKYVPEKLAGKVLAKAFTVVRLLPQDRGYSSTPVVEQYKKQIPMRWMLRSVDEFRTFADFLKEGVADNSKKTILLLEIDDVTYSANEVATSTELDQDDKDFLNNYFELPSNQEEVTFLQDFFADSRRYLREKTSATEGAKPKLKYSTTRESIFEYTLKTCRDFKSEEFVAPIIKNGVPMLAGAVIFYSISKIPAVKNKAEELANKYLERKPSNIQKAAKGIFGTAKQLIKA